MLRDLFERAAISLLSLRQAPSLLVGFAFLDPRGDMPRVVSHALLCFLTASL